MGEVKRVVSSLMQMLDKQQREANSLVDTMHRLHEYLEQESRSIIQASLDRLLDRIRAEAAKITSGLVVILVSPAGRVTVGTTYSGYSDENSDPWLRRLKSEGFRVMSVDKFSSLIDSLKSEVRDNFVSVIEFLKANTEFQWPVAYSSAPAIAKSEQDKPSAPSRWKPLDFLPAGPPNPPLPRGLFKD